MVRARSVLLALGVARGLFLLGLLCFFLSFLTPGFSAVGDLRQKLPDRFNLLLGPRVDWFAADLQNLRWRYLPA